ncbi:bifunctional molybdenum cofactor biosynthesis protein MoaC/MoaB [Gordonia sp. VNK21]|uniref:bifunctional molybdenum cofactor biosynthesis protein MoaC/MoaB n=1 Tax=Gordonia sp. VNK21 TaxID=3382483 RepID=UPI0038D4E6FC
MADELNPDPGPAGLTHLRADGTAAMVDVGGKPVTARTAVARGVFVTTAAVIDAIRGGAAPKGDVLATARIAGIAGAKRTSELIPLCHPLPLSKVAVDFELGADRIEITATASTTGRTGVEMEALTAVTVAGLTLHDMVKALDPAGQLTEVGLHQKTGGRHGHWERESFLAERAAHAPETAAADNVPLHPGRRAVVLVVSTGSAQGRRTDRTGPVIAEWLTAQGLTVQRVQVVADADFPAALSAALADRPAVLITTGGTGPTRDDRVPEAAAAVLTVPIPGIAEAMRARGLDATPLASLSRGVAGLAGGTFLATLPGSTGGVRDGLAVLGPVVAHLLELADGTEHAGDEHHV